VTLRKRCGCGSSVILENASLRRSNDGRSSASMDQPKTTEKNKLRLTKQSQTALQAGAVPVIMQPPWGEHFGIA